MSKVEIPFKVIQMFLFCFIVLISCEICQPGEYSVEDECEICPVGFYCPDGLQIDSCKKGYFCGERGFSSEQNCKAGYFCPNSTVQLPCGIGSFNVEGKNFKCKSCHPGYYCEECSISKYGQTEESEDYELCPEGFICPYSDITVSQCNDGEYCPEGSVVAVQCPDDHYCVAGLKFVCPKNLEEGEVSPCPSNGDLDGDDNGEVVGLLVFCSLVATCSLVCCTFATFCVSCGIVLFCFDICFCRSLLCLVTGLKKKRGKMTVHPLPRGIQGGNKELHLKKSIPALPLHSFLDHIGLSHYISDFEKYGLTWDVISDINFDRELFRKIMSNPNERKHFEIQLTSLCDVPFKSSFENPNSIKSDGKVGLEKEEEGDEGVFISVYSENCKNHNRIKKKKRRKKKKKKKKKVKKKKFREMYKNLIINNQKVCLLEVISHGTFGIVWKGMIFREEDPMGTPCAIKVGKNGKINKEEEEDVNITDAISLSIGSTSSAGSVFEDPGNLSVEIQNLRNLVHPNVIELYGCWFAGNDLHLCMEYCDGGNLMNLIKKWRKTERRKKTRKKESSFMLSTKEDEMFQFQARLIYKVEILLQISAGMKYLHKKGVFHRDLKPSNILFKDHEKQTIKICDFGFSKNSQTMNQSVCGTAEYLAPELMTKESGEKKCALIDIYSFGIILWEVVAERCAFYKVRKKYRDPYEFLRQVHSKNRLRPKMSYVVEKEVRYREENGTLGIMKIKFPEKLGELIKKCWKHNPKSRMQNFQDIFDCLRDILKVLKENQPKRENEFDGSLEYDGSL